MTMQNPSADSHPAEQIREPSRSQSSWRIERGAATLTILIMVVFFICCGIVSFNAGIGSLRNPESGFWPLVVSIVGVLSSVGTLFWTSTRFVLSPEGHVGRVLAAVVTLAAFPLTYYYLGLPITSFIVSMIIMRFIGGEKWLLSTIVSALVSGCTYYIFVVLLRVPM
jgi:hypothetical protein